MGCDGVVQQDEGLLHHDRASALEERVERGVLGADVQDAAVETAELLLRLGRRLDRGGQLGERRQLLHDLPTAALAEGGETAVAGLVAGRVLAVERGALCVGEVVVHDGADLEVAGAVQECIEVFSGGR